MINPRFQNGRFDLVNVSGGVDSTACYLLRLEQGNDFRAVFADTGNEHEATLEYIQSLPEKTGGPPVTIVKADFSQRMEVRRMGLEMMLGTGEFHEGWNRAKVERVLSYLQPTGIPFLDMCMYKGRFPSNKFRFCTVELKLSAIRNQVVVQMICDAVRMGHDASSVVSWIGIRRDESPERAYAEEWEYENMGNRIYRPLVDWTKKECFDLLARWGVPPNPLYKQGCGRVGCMPCINANKNEMLAIAKRWPQHVDRIREWESLVRLCSKQGQATFFHCSKVPGESPTRAHIDAVVEWSMTRTGGKQMDIFKQMEEPPACSSLYGLCE